ncbi:hypothetical protein ACFLU6_11400 [Acidobacteriota bacterium]
MIRKALIAAGIVGFFSSLCFSSFYVDLGSSSPTFPKTNDTIPAETTEFLVKFTQAVSENTLYLYGDNCFDKIMLLNSQGAPLPIHAAYSTSSCGTPEKSKVIITLDGSIALQPNEAYGLLLAAKVISDPSAGCITNDPYVEQFPINHVSDISNVLEQQDMDGTLRQCKTCIVNDPRTGKPGPGPLRGFLVIPFFTEGYAGDPEPTCDDGIQNGGEEGVDCGGPCITPCPGLASDEYDAQISCQLFDVPVFNNENFYIWVEAVNTGDVEWPVSIVQPKNLEGWYPDEDPNFVTNIRLEVVSGWNEKKYTFIIHNLGQPVAPGASTLFVIPAHVPCVPCCPLIPPGESETHSITFRMAHYENDAWNYFGNECTATFDIKQRNADSIAGFTGEDYDCDTLPDQFEQAVLNQFHPRWFVGADDCGHGQLPATIADSDTVHPAVFTKWTGTASIYGQVFKPPVVNDDPCSYCVEVHWYDWWRKDCGFFNGHSGDPEGFQSLVCTDSSDFAHADLSQWFINKNRFNAHGSSACEHTYGEGGLTESGPVDVWVAHSKHGSFESKSSCDDHCCFFIFFCDDCDVNDPHFRCQDTTCPEQAGNLGEFSQPMPNKKWVQSNRLGTQRINKKMESVLNNSRCHTPHTWDYSGWFALPETGVIDVDVYGVAEGEEFPFALEFPEDGIDYSSMYSTVRVRNYRNDELMDEYIHEFETRPFILQTAGGYETRLEYFDDQGQGMGNKTYQFNVSQDPAASIAFDRIDGNVLNAASGYVLTGAFDKSFEPGLILVSKDEMGDGACYAPSRLQENNKVAVDASNFVVGDNQISIVVQDRGHTIDVVRTTLHLDRILR